MRMRTLLGATAVIACLSPPAAAAPTVVGGILLGIGLTADLLALYTAAGGAGPPVDKLTIKTTATETSFALSLVGGAVQTGGEMQFKGQSQGIHNPPGGPVNTPPMWDWDLLISVVDGFFNDSVSIRGHIQHIWAPTGHASDAPQGNPIQFALSITTDGAAAAMTDTLAPRPKCRQHRKDHGDCIDPAVLSGTVDRGTVSDDILNFGLELEAEHVSRAIPEPASLALLLSALLGLSLARLRTSG
jgi:hypothetical protein